MYRITTLLFFLFATLGYSQNEASKWYFGNYAGLDFLSGVPLSIPNSSLQSVEACASVADHSGGLLFYTNSVDVWNKNNQLMANGTSLSGNKSTIQGALIVRKPGSSNLYYIFTLGELGTGTLAYSLVDMTLSGGTGSVVVKNQALMSNMSEKLCGTMHCNNTDVWVLAHKYNSDEYCSFLVTAAGVNTTPVVSAIGSTYALGTPSVHAACSGAMKISPTGKKVGSVINPGMDLIEIFDFDPSTGQLSNGYMLDSISYAWGCEFSPDGTKFYVSQNAVVGQHKIYQWNICAGNAMSIKATKQLIANPGNQQNMLVNLQLATDGRIYISAGASNTLASIHNPNLSGASCNFIPQDVILSTGYSGFGMPNFIGSQLRQKSAITYSTQNSCGLTAFSITPYNFCVGVNYSVQSQSWDFGDPVSGVANTSTLSAVAHQYSKNGKYAVRLITNYQCFSDTLNDTVNVNTFPNLIIQGKNSICKNEAVVLTATGALTYTWSNGSTTNTITLTPKTNTVVTVIGSSSNNCQINSSKTITVNECLNVNSSQSAIATRQIYPNPAKEKFTLISEGGFELTFFSLLGEKLLAVPISAPRQDINLDQLPPSTYIIRYSDQGQKGQLFIKTP